MEEQRRGQGAHPYNVQQALERFERGHIANILELTRWNHRKTAQMLGIPAKVLTSKMQYYQMIHHHNMMIRWLLAWVGAVYSCLLWGRRRRSATPNQRPRRRANGCDPASAGSGIR